MRKLILIGVCLAAAVLSAGEPLYKGKFREFPVPGTIAAAAGTVELTLNPAKPASEFENEWAFAFSMVPAIEGEEAARTLLGICISSGENGQRALLGVAGAESRLPASPAPANRYSSRADRSTSP